MFKKLLILSIVVNISNTQAASQARIDEVYTILKMLEKDKNVLLVELYAAARHPEHKLVVKRREFEQSKEGFKEMENKCLHQAQELGLCDNNYQLDAETAQIIKSSIFCIFEGRRCLVCATCHPNKWFTSKNEFLTKLALLILRY